MTTSSPSSKYVTIVGCTVASSSRDPPPTPGLGACSVVGTGAVGPPFLALALLFKCCGSSVVTRTPQVLLSIPDTKLFASTPCTSSCPESELGSVPSDSTFCLNVGDSAFTSFARDVAITGSNLARSDISCELVSMAQDLGRKSFTDFEIWHMENRWSQVNKRMPRGLPYPRHSLHLPPTSHDRRP